MAKGRKWRRAANALARALWSNGKRYEAHQLMREVMIDADKELKMNEKAKGEAWRERARERAIELGKSGMPMAADLVHREIIADARLEAEQSGKPSKEVKPEMETISYEIPSHEIDELAGATYAGTLGGRNLVAAAKAVRDARKTKLEVWRRSLPGLNVPPEVSSFGGSHTPTTTTVKLRGGSRSGAGALGRLIMAAPALIDALIEMRGEASWQAHSEACFDNAGAAIRAALPKDVADEVLGE